MSALGVFAEQYKTWLLFKANFHNTQVFRLAYSDNGRAFKKSRKKISVRLKSGNELYPLECDNFRIADIGDGFFMTYQCKRMPNAFAGFFSSLVGRRFSNKQLYGARAKDPFHWKTVGAIQDVFESGSVVPNYTFNKQYVLYFGEKTIGVAFSKDLKNWQVVSRTILAPAKDSFDHSPLSVIGSFLVSEGILVLYDSSHMHGGEYILQVGAVLMNKENPKELLWRSPMPVIEQATVAEGDRRRALGATFVDGKLFIYFSIGDDIVDVAELAVPHMLKRSPEAGKLKRYEGNPIINPNPYSSWESKATFNPAALHEEGRVHLLYRAIGEDDISVLGYVASGDGFTVDERQHYPAYFQRKASEAEESGPLKIASPLSYASGGGWNGGTEDPRITLIEDTVYMTYTAFDGWGSLRMALTSIPLSDFLAKKWSWKKPIMISSPGQIHKNWVIFPEKINGKYAVLHSICPDILVEYLDDLDFAEEKFIESRHGSTKGRKSFWDNRVRGAGPPPIKTDKGWLLIYHAMDERDPNKYKMGAMLLDIKDPTKILYRSDQPILEPSEWYENDGWKAGVSYCCGAIVKNGILFVYYGGSDKVVGVATIPLKTFLSDLEKGINTHPHFKRAYMK